MKIKKTLPKVLLFMLTILYGYNIIGTQSSKSIDLRYKQILEIPFYSSENSNDTLFKIMVSPEKYNDYFIIDEKSITMLSGQFPQLLTIRNENFYINNNYQGLRVYNINGECTYSLNYKPRYFVDYKSSKIDSEGNLYLVMNNPNDNNDFFGYKIKDTNGETELLNSNDVGRLSLQQNLSELNVHRDIDPDKNNNSTIVPENSDFSLLKDPDGRFLSITRLVISNNNNKVSEINISSIPGKIIFTKLYYIDKDQNVYVIGLKSNQYEWIKRTTFNDQVIKVLNPVFFIWKFEK